MRNSLAVATRLPGWNEPECLDRSRAGYRDPNDAGVWPAIGCHLVFATSATSGARRLLDPATALLAAQSGTMIGIGQMHVAVRKQGAHPHPATLKRRLGEALGRAMTDPQAPTDQQLAERITGLEQQLFETREALRDRDEQLQAVRTLNQRLLKESNARGAR